ncbi:MAG: hypothetical protein H0W42_12220 [Gemmatimonadaceae bacterium]|nr:hypothetical protein [Gemmatimonadaceae bacterium]
MTDRLDDGEAIENAEVHLWRLYAMGETDDIAVDANLDGAPQVIDTRVVQRINDLERGRCYRMEILYGAAGNRRGNVLFIRVLS